MLVLASQGGGHAVVAGAGRNRQYLAERGNVEIHGDFCGQRYEFDAVGLRPAFTPAHIATGARRRSSPSLNWNRPVGLAIRRA
ncbi:hypothetical protein ACTMU2_29675 [Cupriavidus basilensis]